jgi:phosphatidylserine/phosphatidylglycerophosphate/cardiolipin synthase-like enzyme
VLELINGATSSIDIEQQYIKLGGATTRALLEALASRRAEVKIRILASPAFRESWDQTVTSLEAFGLADLLRAMNLGYFTHLHNKGVLVDRRISVVTSTNWSENSITQAREAGVVVESAEIGEYYGRVIDLDWSVGLAPQDVPNRLAALSDTLDAVQPQQREFIHPADLR